MEIRHIVFLLVVFILYVIFGGLIFMFLESPEEQIKRKEIETILNEFAGLFLELVLVIINSNSNNSNPFLSFSLSQNISEN